MTVHLPPLRFSLDPLIAEAKRRMRRRRALVALSAVLVLGGVAGAAVILNSPSAGGRDTKPLKQARISEGLVENGHPVGGELSAHAKRGDLIDLRVFVRGAGGPGGVVHLGGYGIAARVKRQPPASGFWARLRFRATQVGRFAVVMERPHVRVGYVIVTPD